VLREAAVKDKAEVDQIVDDLLRGNQDLDDVPAELLPRVEDRVREKAAERMEDPVRGGINLADLGRVSVEDILNILQSADVPDDFSFEEKFKKGLEQPRVRAGGAAAQDPARAQRRGRGGAPEAPNEPKEPKNKFFQPTTPVHMGEPGLKRKDRSWVAKQVEKILMDEFVSPAMGLGMNILPSVWVELNRLMKSDPRGFMPAFQVALNSVRETENAWFAYLLGIGAPEHTTANVPREVQATADRIREILNMYYEAVLEEAGRNSDNLIEKLEKVESMTDRETFEQGFFDAISKTRDIEDQAFGQFMGGPRRLR
jgi:hypothetical protein